MAHLQKGFKAAHLNASKQAATTQKFKPATGSNSQKHTAGELLC